MIGAAVSRGFWVGLAAWLGVLSSCEHDSRMTTTAADAAAKTSVLDAAPKPDATAQADAAAPKDAATAAAAPARDAAADAGRAPSGPCSPPAEIDQPAARLRDTGCMDAQRPTQLAAAVIPYEVNSPLWSDSADKLRGMMLPAGAKIHVKDCAKQPGACPAGTADDGQWVFPVGTVLVKSFGFDGKLVETRLFVRFDAETWVGYSYQWNEQQTEASIVPDERRKVTFDTGSRTVEWNYPSRIDCMKCHNPAGGSTLGPETAQMNRSVAGQNQIDKLAALDLFDAPIPKPYAAALVAPYPSQSGSPPAAASIDTRARSYLHANCGFCHRPDADFPNIDLRHAIPLSAMNICGVVPAKGDVGVPSATNLTPGKPMESIMWLRVHAQPGEGRMPQIGTYRVDDAGLALLGNWIDGIQACP
jgi:uncharacterized repeat protein (TIGR03806 family)